jgi:ribosomal protein L37AE/L43A
MTNYDEFFNSKANTVPSTWEEIGGIRPCSKCEEDVDGGLWDPNTLTLKWTCKNKHENTFTVS